MSGTWSHGPQPFSPAQPGNGAPGLICFNCGQNHLLVHCRAPKNSGHGPPQAAPFSQQQQFPGTNYHGSAQTGSNQPHQLYPQHQQYAPTPNQPAFSYNQGPPQQSYSAPPVNTPYGNIPYQAHQTYQYSGPVPTQYGGPPHMNLGPSNNEQYAMSQNTIPFETQSLHPHGNQTGGYGGSINPPHPNFQGPVQQQQWNTMQPPVQKVPPHQRQQRSHSDVIYKSSTSGFHAQSAQPVQGHSKAQSSDRPPIAQGPVAKRERQFNAGIPRNTPSTTISQSNGPNAASSKRGSDAVSVVKDVDKSNLRTTKSATASSRTEESIETVDELDKKQQFEWDMACIFTDPPATETVRLACPLSISFAVTPVPLLNTESMIPVSRFVKGVSVKDFSKSVRDGPTWSAINTDPAFVELNLDGPLVPIDDIPRWMAHRQGITDYIRDDLITTRKRTRPHESAIDASAGLVDGHIVTETDSESHEEAPPSKRQKNEEVDQKMSRVGTPVIETQTYVARGGTPCLVNDDQAWAPEPGERAASPATSEDPTEALLASLGVTGAPKPVNIDPVPPYAAPQHDLQESITEQTSTGPSLQRIKARGPRGIDQQRNSSLPIPTNLGPSNHIGLNPQNQSFNYSNGPHKPHHQGAAQSGPQNTPLQYNKLRPATNEVPQLSQNNYPAYQEAQPFQYQSLSPSQGQIPYANASQSHPYVNSNGQGHVQAFNGNYGPQQPPHPAQAAYANVNTISPLSYTNQAAQFHQPRMNGNTLNGQLQHEQFGFNQATNTVNGQIQHIGSAPIQHGHSINGRQQMHHASYGPPIDQRSKHQYGSAPGPQQLFNFSGNQPNTFGPQHHGQSDTIHNGNNHNALKPNNQLEHFSSGLNKQSNNPTRQDSGYSSSGGSHSNGLNKNTQRGGQNSQRNLQQIAPPNGPVASNKPENDDGRIVDASSPITYGNASSGDEIGHLRDPSDSTVDGSPLSPMSREILGSLLVPAPRKSSGTKKRPAPVVDEAYSRRW